MQESMQAADLSSDFFALFGLPRSFDIDLDALAECYREAQRVVHPDKFANASEAERRLSVQMAARVNEGYRILKAPLTRARYLLELLGVELDDMDTAFDGAFLMEQMELRERLAAVRSSAAKEGADPLRQLQAISQDISAHGKTLTTQMAELLRAADTDSLWQARDITRKLQFFHRLNEEVDALDEELNEF